ncbi:hypothetical protein BDP81DRAFT_497583 [Colletotrichum phormii]|uniref:Uncharacterized protein n=1 Tax=Colletotrichum phormii TaxID=359342 RepID=A0AAJ0EKK0_9PEZI|nr:uncharacterized protein BDP81DRAFT_497583 [Colletotrichum phormii]KAK1654662.1 hypothetical protein BDP81DRAFT_497583 [Colletotrichum phormii]
MPSTPSVNSAAAARASNTFALVFLMLMVFTLTFGASMVQVSIQGYLRQVVCRQQYGLPEKTPIENGLCHTDAVDKQLEWVEVVAQVCQSAGGLLSAYPLGKRSDTKGRRGAFISGACLWGLFSGILVTSVQISSWGVIWFLFFAIGAGKTCVEVAVLAMTSDTTDDRQRSKHFGLVISSALTGLVVSNVIHRYAPPMALEIAALIGCVAFCVGTNFIVAFPELLYAQHEAFRGEPSPEIFPANQAAVRPLHRVVSTLITYRALPLLAILSLVLTLARTVPSSLDFYFAARYNPHGGLEGHPYSTYRGGVVSYWTPLVGIILITCLLLPSIYCCPNRRRVSGDRIALRDYGHLLVATGLVVLTSATALYRNQLVFLVGMVSATAIATTIPGQCYALMLYGLGVAVRAKYAGRLFGLAATAQCATTLVLGPAIGLATRESHWSGVAVAVVFVASAVFFVAVWAAEAVCAAPMYERPGAGGGVEAGIELLDVGGLAAPPPVYAAHQEERPAPMPMPIIRSISPRYGEE